MKRIAIILMRGLAVLVPVGLGVLAIIVYQDRTEAKGFIRQEKALAGLRNLQVGPVFAQGFKGAALGFRF